MPLLHSSAGLPRGSSDTRAPCRLSAPSTLASTVRALPALARWAVTGGTASPCPSEAADNGSASSAPGVSSSAQASDRCPWREQYVHRAAWYPRILRGWGVLALLEVQALAHADASELASAIYDVSVSSTQVRSRYHIPAAELESYCLNPDLRMAKGLLPDFMPSARTAALSSSPSGAFVDSGRCCSSGVGRTL